MTDQQPQTLLFVGGGIETVPGVNLARSMGLRVLVSDRNPQAPCMALADGALIADTYDGPATSEAARVWCSQNGPLHGVICLATDVPHTVARVAADFGLPGISPQSAALAVDKLAMKQRFAQRGVAIPFFEALSDEQHLHRLIAERGLPLVIKPVDSRGARGVLRLTETVDPNWAFDYARSFSPSGRVMLEQYLAGPQLSSESLVIDGQVYTPGISDRNYALLETYAPFFIEDGGDLPSYLDDEIIDQVRQLVARAATALEIRDGVVKGDIVVSEGKPYIIEVATRLSGGYFCSHSIPMNTGVELVRHAISRALGRVVDPNDLKPRYQRHVCQRYLFPKSGRVVAVEGEQEARSDPRLAYLEIRVKAGDEVAGIENHPCRAGVLMTTGNSREEAREAAEKAVSRIHIITSS